MSNYDCLASKPTHPDGCIDCGFDIIKGMRPPRTARLGLDGGVMTKAEASHLFVDSRGGRCADCYLKHEKAEVSRVAALHRADPGIRTRLWSDFGGFNNIRHLYLPQ